MGNDFAFSFILLIVVLGVFSLFEHHQTPAEYWHADGADLIEKARNDEAEALQKVEDTTGQQRKDALIGAELATEVRKRYEEARARSIGKQDGDR